MAYVPCVTISFDCECGRNLRGYIWGDFAGSGDDDMVHCQCGRVYLVARPYIVEAKEVRERAEG